MWNRIIHLLSPHEPIPNDTFNKHYQHILCAKHSGQLWRQKGPKNDNNNKKNPSCGGFTL